MAYDVADPKRLFVATSNFFTGKFRR